MKKLFVVEDEKNIQDIISIYFKSRGYQITSAYDYIDAWEILNAGQKFDLILLDWMLPKGNGIKLLELMRCNPELEQVPVIMVSAKTEVEDRIYGLNKGCDDYITKPFSLKELDARFQAQLRKKNQKINEKTAKELVVEFKGIKIDTIAHRVFINGVDIHIRRIEYKLLLFFLNNTERVLNRAQLLDNVWGVNTYVDERTVDVSIGRLKKLLKPSAHDQYLQTVRGAGYRFSKMI